jgi:hypothetical protein
MCKIPEFISVWPEMNFNLNAEDVIFGVSVIQKMAVIPEDKKHLQPETKAVIQSLKKC